MRVGRRRRRRGLAAEEHLKIRVRVLVVVVHVLTRVQVVTLALRLFREHGVGRGEEEQRGDDLAFGRFRASDEHACGSAAQPSALVAATLPAIMVRRSLHRRVTSIRPHARRRARAPSHPPNPQIKLTLFPAPRAPRATSSTSSRR